MRIILKVSLFLVLTYSFLLIGLYVAMCQKPHVFTSFMARTPDIVFLAFPFKPMWLSAREGKLIVGDEAPDFSLEPYDKGERVRLSDFRDKKPVALVFGSYT